MGPLRIVFAERVCMDRIERGRRVRKGVLLALQGAGATAGITAVHWALRSLVAGSAPWLCEQPAQLVNDAVAAAAFLTVVWACACDLDLLLLGLALAVLTLYGATSPAWHLDQAPKAPLVTVRNLVVLQSASMALALGLLRSTLGVARCTGTPPR